MDWSNKLQAACRFKQIFSKLQKNFELRIIKMKVRRKMKVKIINIVC